MKLSFSSISRKARAAALASLLIITQLTPAIFSPTSVRADGAGSPQECETPYNALATNDNLATYGAPSGYVITGVCIKAGQLHTNVLTTNGAYINNCFNVAGLGTQMVTVTRPNPANCPQGSGISHIDVVKVPATGSITIVKDAQPNSTTNFEFEIDDQNSSWDQNFTLDDDSGVGDGNNFYASSKTFNNLSPSVYVVEEFDESGWSLANIICDSANIIVDVVNRKVTITLGPTEHITCTFTNQKEGKIKIIKDVQPGTSDQDFSFTANGQGLSNFVLDDNGSDSTSGSGKSSYKIFDDLVAGKTYAFTEDSVSGWSVQNISCPGATVQVNGATVSISLQPGQYVECTFVNVPVQPKLTLVKVISGSQYGDTATVNDFGLSIDGSAVTSGEIKTLPVGSHAINESGRAGYEFVSISGDAKCPQVLGGTVNLALGDNITCVITNKAKEPKLTLKKIAINDNGGTKDSGDFTLYANAVPFTNGVVNNEGPDTTSTSYAASNQMGSYTLSELVETGYTASAWTCSKNLNGSVVTVALGDDITCTITNNDVAPSLTLVKNLVDNYNSGKTVNDWTLFADGLTSISGAGGATSDASFKAGDYTLGETGPGAPGFIMGDWTCSGGTLQGTVLTVSIGDNITCYVTNTSIQPKLTLVKEFVGDGDQSDFTPVLNGVDSTWGTHGVDTGDYEVTETMNVPGYRLNGVSCYKTGYPAQGVSHPVTLDVGDDVTCVVTNEQLSQVIVTKYNDLNGNGERDDFFGSLEPTLEGFTINLNDDSVVTDEDGVADFGYIPANEYELSEEIPNGWRLTDISCDYGDDSDGYSHGYNSYEIYLGYGDTVTCEIGNASDGVDIDIDKTNNTSGAVSTESTVTYTLTVTNPVGSGLLVNPSVVDTPPAGFTYVGGSWTAISNYRGDLKAAGIVREPTTGEWTFDGADPSEDVLYPGEVVVMTYQMKVAKSVLPGDHTNTAVVEACAPETTILYRGEFENSVLDDIIDDPSECVSDEASSTVKVKGVTIVLANTGNEAFIGIIAGLTLLVTAAAVSNRKFALKKNN